MRGAILDQLRKMELLLGAPNVLLGASTTGFLPKITRSPLATPPAGSAELEGGAFSSAILAISVANKI